MNQPEERFTRLENQQRDVERTQDMHTEFLRELSKKSDTHTHMLIAERTDILLLQNNVATLQDDVSTLKTEMREARADIISIKATQSDHGELLKEHGEMLKSLKATQDEQGQKLDLILQLLQKKSD